MGNPAFEPGSLVKHKLTGEKMIVLPVPISDRDKETADITYVRQVGATTGLLRDFHIWFYSVELEKQ